MNNKITICPLWLLIHFRISGTEGKRLHIITKDVPIFLIIQEISRIWGALNQKLWIKTKTYIYYKSQHHNDLIWVPWKAESETKAFAQVAYLANDPKEQQWRANRSEMGQEGKAVCGLLISSSPLGLYLAENPLKSLIESTSKLPEELKRGIFTPLLFPQINLVKFASFQFIKSSSQFAIFSSLTS